VRHILIILSFLLLTLPSAVYSAQKRVALVIGNGAYKEGPLRNPVNDARLMRNLLRKAGFSVTIVENATKRELVSAIRNFGNTIRYSDAALFYFSGHGNQYNSRNWLIPIGADIQRESDLEFEAVNAERILAEMEGGSSKRVNIVMFDACRSNRSFRSLRSAKRGLAQPQVQPEGSIVAFSTAPGTVAYDGAGRNSPYVAELSKHMLTPGLKIEDVFKRVRVGVKSRTSRKPSPQIPWENSAMTGDFYFMFADQAETSTESVSSYNEIAGSENEEQLTEERIPEVAVDPMHGWTWQKKPDGVKRNYEEAVKYCKNLSIGDFSYWVLPSVLRLKQVFKRKYIFSSYKIDSLYWSTDIWTHEYDVEQWPIKSKREVSSITPTVVNFKNLLVHPRAFSDLKNDYARQWRKSLDDDYGFLSSSVTAWAAKRQSVENRIAKETPGYTKFGLEKAFDALGLSIESDPRNKHYVRCMHD